MTTKRTKQRTTEATEQRTIECAICGTPMTWGEMDEVIEWLRTETGYTMDEGPMCWTHARARRTKGAPLA